MLGFAGGGGGGGGKRLEGVRRMMEDWGVEAYREVELDGGGDGG